MDQVFLSKWNLRSEMTIFEKCIDIPTEKFHKQFNKNKNTSIVLKYSKLLNLCVKIHMNFVEFSLNSIELFVNSPRG